MLSSGYALKWKQSSTFVDVFMMKTWPLFVSGTILDPAKGHTNAR